VAGGQEPAASTRLAARELAVSGAEAFDQHDFDTALDRFQRAESLYKAPSIAVMVARCLLRVGRVVEAVDKYEQTLRMPLEPGAPEAFQRAVTDASSEVEAARARLARIELSLGVNAPDDVVVLLDDVQVPKALLGVPTPVNPGLHRIAARAPGRRAYVAEVSVTEGETRFLAISLPEPGSPADGAAASGSGQAHASSTESDKPVATLSVALLTGGGVALVVGAVSGVVALKHKSELDEVCSPGCPTSMASSLETFRWSRGLSYVSFGLGAVALGSGAYLLLQRSATGTEVRASLLPGGAAVTGTF
jgi:hypothetical protein